MMPIQNEIISVNEVMVIDTAASDNMCPIRSGTDNFTDVRRQAANITKVSSIPIPVNTQQKKMINYTVPTSIYNYYCVYYCGLPQIYID